MFIEFTLTTIMLIFAMINDFKSNTIKNIIPSIGIILGFICSFFLNDNSIPFIILTCIIYFLLLFYLPRAIGITEFLGAGDIKIYMAITFLMGYKFSLYSFIYSIFIGCIFLIILNIKRTKDISMNIFSFFALSKENTSKIIDNKKANIFSPYIFIGSIVTYIQLFIMQNDWLFEAIISSF